MIYLNKNSSTSAQKIDLENSFQQTFATISKLLIFRHIYNFFLKEEVNKIEFFYWVSYIRFSSCYLLRKQTSISLMVSDFSKIGRESNTVLSSINGLSKRRTPLIRGQFCFPRRNSGQTLIKNFLKSGRHMCLTGWYLIPFLLSYFLLEMVLIMNEFTVIKNPPSFSQKLSNDYDIYN